MSVVDTATVEGSDWRRRLQKARAVAASEGVPRLLARSLRWSLASHLDAGRLQFFMRDLRAPLPPEPEVPDDLRLRLARPDDLERILRCGNEANDRALVTYRFQRGDQCFLAVDPADEVAHCRWVTTGRAWVPELEADVVLGPGHAYMYDGFTRPDMRRRGIDGMVRTFIFRTLRESGRRGVHSCVRGDNPVGMRAARRWQQPTGHVWHLRFRRLESALRYPRQMPDALRIAPPERDEGSDESAWRSWFESWTDKPHEQRSTGFSALPECYFEETAEHIRETLALSPEHDRVLDLGCASAMLSRYVAPSCHTLVGADFMHSLLADAAERAECGGGGRMQLVNADGRRLPFPDGAYTKVYCAGMIHTLPSRADGLRVIDELVRVCEPGGSILLAAVPDSARRWRRYRDIWERGDLRSRARLVAGLVLPRELKRRLRERVSHREGEHLRAIEYDLEGLRDSLREAGLECHLVDFPASYWSRDFRETRSNLLIHVPERASA